MEQKGLIFGRRIVIGLLMFVTMFTFGCSSRLELLQERLGMINDPRLDQVVRKNIEVTGGLELWSQTGSIVGDAIATVYEQDGSSSLIEQQHQVNAGKCFSVTVISKESSGELREYLDGLGRVTVIHDGAEESILEQDRAVLYGAGLKLLLEGQSITGLFCWLEKDVTVRYSALERKGGRASHKLEITGRLLARDSEEETLAVDDLLVVWVNAESFHVERLWFQYQKPGRTEKFGYLAAQVSDYQQEPSGLTLPGRIEFLSSNKDQQFSRSHILSMEFLRLKGISEADKKRNGSFFSRVSRIGR